MKGRMMILAAARLARKAHAGQKRKHGTPYFGHPAAVARALWNAGHRNPALIAAAYTHDVLEDAPAYAGALEKVLSPEALSLVRAVTKEKGESLEAYFARVRMAGPLAMALKEADRAHNNSELKYLPEGHPVRAKAATKTAAMKRAFHGG